VDSTGEAGNSDDSFLYLRCHVIAQGKAFYENVLNNPTEIPNSIECWAQSLLFVAAEAWSSAMGRDQEEYMHNPKHSYATFSNTANW